MHSLLADGTKFLELAEEWKNCIFKSQDKGYIIVEELFKKKTIWEDRSHLKNSESRQEILCGAPKVQKRDSPLRPILSTTNSYNYSLSKFLVTMLSPLCNGAYIESRLMFRFDKGLQVSIQWMSAVRNSLVEIYTNFCIKNIVTTFNCKTFACINNSCYQNKQRKNQYNSKCYWQYVKLSLLSFDYK